MTDDHIRKLLREGEGLTVEFKECVNGLSNNVWETVCSFSNRYGGHILLGVEDDGTVIGVNPNAVPGMKKNFVNTLNNPQKVAPPMFLNLDEIKIDGKTVLYVYVPAGSQLQSCGRRIYDRGEDGDFDITSSTELIAHLSIRKSNQFTERRIFPYAREEHLRLKELMPTVRQMAVNRRPKHPWRKMTDMGIMKSAGLYEEDIITGSKGFNLAGVMLFGREEILQQAVPGYVTDCLLRVENINRYDDRERVEVNLIESFDLLIEFIRKHTNDRFFLIDNLNVSVRDHIAKEIVSNILVHREFSGTFPARIIIEKNRILAENWNRPLRPGKLDPDNYEPYPKNPILARFFVNIGFADTLGSGVRNLYEYSKIYSGDEPELIEGDVFKTIVPLLGTPSIRDVHDNVLDEIAELLPNNLTESNEVAELLPNNVAGKLTSGELIFLKSLLPSFALNEWITNTEVRNHTGNSAGSVKRFLRNLTGKGILEARGATKDRQYRLKRSIARSGHPQ
jgi:ATP-dependent DNA helicase RecG